MGTTHTSLCVKCGCGSETSNFDWDALSSPHRCLFESNDPPPDHDIPRLRSIISEGRARVALLDERIASLQAELERIIPERNKLDENVRQFASVVSPLRGGMPEELLSKIFLAEVSTINSDTPMEHAVMAVRGAFCFGQICRRWRTIALSLPLLWAVVALDFNTEIWGETGVSLPMLETQLQRSGHQPLTILLRSFPHGCERSQTHALDMLVRQSWRWEVAALYISPDLFPQIAGLEGRLPRLNSLRIEITGGRVHGSSAFKVAPSLRNVYWRSALSRVSLPSSQLRRYRGVSSWNGHLEVLRSASQLTGCALILHDEEGASEHSRAHLPRLLDLFVSNVNFLHRLETPALEELTVFKDLNPVLSLLRRSSSPLRRLVCYACTGIAVLTTILENVPSITEISIQFSSEDPGPFISRLARNDENYGPNLESISLDVGLSRSPNESIFLDAVVSRWRSGKLRAATLFTRNPLLVNTQRRVEALNAQGFDLTISNGYMRWLPAEFGLQ
ncbi:hypothetical protein FB451DRAFT_1415767 [Mycena latifolia]|nr:hypothetical protein FB451DRAFT_1415767 [Mycena latifolia]